MRCWEGCGTRVRKRALKAAHGEDAGYLHKKSNIGDAGESVSAFMQAEKNGR